MSSVQQTLLSDLVSRLETMTVSNGYRQEYSRVSTTFKGIEQITQFPEVMVFLGDSSLTPEDAPKTVFSEHTQVLVAVAIKSTSLQKKNDDNDLANQAEIAIHDVTKCLTGWVTTNINDATRRYHIEGKDGMFRIARLYPLTESTGIIEFSFTVRVRWNTSSTF